MLNSRVSEFPAGEIWSYGSGSIREIRKTEMSNFVFLAFPLELTAYSIWRLRGIWRFAAIGCFVVYLPVVLWDTVRWMHGANPSEFFTLCLVPTILPTLLVLNLSFNGPNTSAATERSHSTQNKPSIASFLIFAGILCLWFVPAQLVHFGGPYGLSRLIGHWSVGGVLALVAACVFFRRMMQTKTRTNTVRDTWLRATKIAALWIVGAGVWIAVWGGIGEVFAPGPRHWLDEVTEFMQILGTPEFFGTACIVHRSWKIIVVVLLAPSVILFMGWLTFVLTYSWGAR